MQIQLEQANDSCSIIHLKGDLTSLASDALTEAHRQATQDGIRTIILHFHQDTYINSAGLALLLSLAAEGQQQTQQLMAVIPMLHFHKIFEMVNLTHYVTLYQTLDEALSAAGVDYQSSYF